MCISAIIVIHANNHRKRLNTDVFAFDRGVFRKFRNDLKLQSSKTEFPEVGQLRAHANGPVIAHVKALTFRELQNCMAVAVEHISPGSACCWLSESIFYILDGLTPITSQEEV